MVYHGKTVFILCDFYYEFSIFIKNYIHYVCTGWLLLLLQKAYITLSLSPFWDIFIISITLLEKIKTLSPAIYII
jgi:hypothetical protein